MNKDKYEVVLETTVYYSVFVDAEDQDAAADKALDRGVPQVHLPNGFEIDDRRWFVGGVVAVGDE